MSSKRKKSVVKDKLDSHDLGTDYTNRIAQELLEYNEEENIDDLIIDKEGDLMLSTTPCLATLACIILPCSICSNCLCLDEGNVHVNLVCGKYSGTVSDAGCYYKNCWGLETRTVSKRIRCYDLENTKIVDNRGNPINASAVVVYQILNARRSVLEVHDVHSHVINQASVTLKSTVSRYPYELMDGDPPEKECLKKNSKRIERMMTKNLQENVINIGVKIHSLQFNELSYAPEIAHGMLKKQGALVTLSAKQKISEGAINIAYGAVEKLIEKGIDMSPEEKTMLVSNLLISLCSESEESDWHVK